MVKSKGKTISGAMDSFPNLEHNIREHVPPNSEKDRRNRNVICTNNLDEAIKAKNFWKNLQNIFMTYIPYTSYSKTGVAVQNAFAQT